MDLPVSPFAKRNLALSNPLDHRRVFTESRNTSTVLKLESHFVEDITSTEVQTVDDLKKVCQVLEEISKNMGGGQLRDFAFIMKWHQSSEEQKNNHYSAKTSHELNLFCYLKDRPYFESVVRPFIACKLEKTFVDLYLLDMFDALYPFAFVPKLQHLNALEKCLLLEALVRHGKSEDAKDLHDHIRDQGALFHKKFNSSMTNKIFDIVLSLNALKSTSERGDLDRFMAEEAAAPHDDRNMMARDGALFS